MPVQGVMVHGYSNDYPGIWYSAATDSRGYYELNVPADRLSQFRVASTPKTYEGDGSYGVDVSPGQRDFVSRKVVSVSGLTYQLTVGNRHEYRPSARFDDGTSRLLGGHDPVQPTASDATILRVGGTDGSSLYIDGLAPGNVTTVIGFWGTNSEIGTVTVLAAR
jgi:hypothetical protein